jgi:hypothetical protein
MHVTPLKHHRADRLRMRLLCTSLLLAMGSGAAGAHAREQVAFPHSWPIGASRDAQITPLRARIDALPSGQRKPPEQVNSTQMVTHCRDDDTLGSLRRSVSESISGDTVDLSQLTCSRISLRLGHIEIGVEELHFVGPGRDALTIDGNDTDRIFLHASGGLLSFSDMTLERGRHIVGGTDIAYGGCIATGAELVLESVTVRDCNAIGVGAYGGGVLSGLLRMSNSTISGNTAFGNHPTNGTAAYGGGAFSYGVEIVDSTISGNRAIGAHNPPLTHWEIGGGIFVARNGGLIERTTISNNYAMRFAGGITQEGDLTVRNSTISGNIARDDDGGGLRVRQVTAVTIENSTIAFNQAGTDGGGISFINFASPSTIVSTIISDNRAGSSATDIHSTMPLVISGSHNLIRNQGTLLSLPSDTLTVDPMLRPLANYGGTTRTHALPVNSPAIDRGIKVSALYTDQRGDGFLRTDGKDTDIGAFEYQIPRPNQIFRDGFD